jgi:hypothetical protein
VINLIIVYELIPEKTSFYMFSCTKEEYENIKLAHGNFINLTDCTGMARIHCERVDRLIEDMKELDMTEPLMIEGAYTIIHTGFYL